MTTSAFDVGDVKRCQCTFTTIAGALTNPTTVTLIIREPDGVETSFTGGQLTNPSAGVFHLDFTIAKRGRHIERWLGTGAVAVAEKVEFYARRKGTTT